MIIKVARGIDIGKKSLYDKFFYVACQRCKIPRWIKKHDYKEDCNKSCRKCFTHLLGKSRIGIPSWNKGISWGQESREKMSIAQKGKKRPDLSGDHHWARRGSKTKTASEIRSLIISKLKGRKINPAKIRRGPQSHNWKGGISKINENARKSDEFIKWRKDVYARDNYTCQKCGKHGGRINAHHIIPFAIDIDKRFDLDNGVTLCIPCHSRIHMNKRWENVRNNNTVSIVH